MYRVDVANLIDPFRDKTRIAALVEQIHLKVKNLREPLHIMEVCGGHTHTIMRYGFPQLLPNTIRFIHGPGCPVCVMPRARIDEAYTLALQNDVILLTLGDMIRIPGSFGSLGEARAKGADVRFVYSPMEALKIAQENPQKKVIFFAIGFETTTPMSVALLQRALQQGISNLFLHVNHITVPEPLRVILDSKESQIHALLAPSHVSVITGAKLYKPLCEDYKIPIVIAGFEPTDILESLLHIVEQKLKGEAQVYNQYSRCVTEEGNIKAQELIEKFLQKCDFEWRGLGVIADSAWKLKQAYQNFDAEIVFKDCLGAKESKEHKLCLCGEILRGAKIPTDCSLFGKACTPRNPIGSCMVSSEGACAAYYKYAFV